MIVGGEDLVNQVGIALETTKEILSKDIVTRNKTTLIRKPQSAPVVNSNPAMTPPPPSKTAQDPHLIDFSNSHPEHSINR